MITNTRTLRAMTKAGFIVWEDGTDRHWTGLPVKRRFVHEGPKLSNWYDEFRFGRHTYRLHYVDGCFHPFVFRTDQPVPSFI